MDPNFPPESTYTFPVFTLDASSWINLKLLFGVCLAFSFVYVIAAAISRRDKTESVRDIVVLIFNLYGINVCLNVIYKAWNYVFTYTLEQMVWDPQTTTPIKIKPDIMGNDELVLIFIGGVAVGYILSEQVVLLMKEPLLAAYAVVRDRKKTTTSTDTH